MWSQSLFCLHATIQFLILFSVLFQLYCLCQNQLWSIGMSSAKFITMHHIHFLSCTDCASCHSDEDLLVVSAFLFWQAYKSPHQKEHFIWMSRVPDEKALPKEPPIFLAIEWSQNILQIPLSLFPCRKNVCLCVRLTESGYFIPLVRSGTRRHLLVVKSIWRRPPPQLNLLSLPVLPLPITSKIWPDLPSTHHLLSSKKTWCTTFPHLGNLDNFSPCKSINHSSEACLSVWMTLCWSGFGSSVENPKGTCCA